MEGNIAATYALIYHFLRQQSQGKAAEAVKKAAKPFIVLRDDLKQEGPPLEDIIKEWKTRKSTKSGDADSSSESSDSSDDSSSSSEDSSGAGSSSEDTSGSGSEDNDTSDSDDSDEGIKAKELPTKSAAERDTSVTLSSAGENAREATKIVIQIPEKKATQDESEGSESDSSDSDSSSKSSDAETSSSSSDSSSSSESSDEDEANANEKAPQNKVTTSEDESSSSSESSSDSESEQEEDVHVTKKRKTSESGAAVTTAVASGSEQIARPSAGPSQRRGKSPPKMKERFQRVKAENLAPELFLDNGYKARGGASSDYGERAHRDLIVTRGAGFRKEKNKKKRGSYRGGEITMENRSIKFDF